MISLAIINLGLVGLTCLFMIVYMMKFVFKYKSEYESNPLCTCTVLFCLLITLLMAFLLPIDIFLVSFIKEPDGTLKQWATNQTLTMIEEGVYGTYYTLYTIMSIMIFVVLPFLHFFNEESESNARDRFYKALKITLGFLIPALILVGIGALKNYNMDSNPIFDKALSIKGITKFQGSILMVLTVIYLMGFINVSFYTASGLFSWPIGLLLGTSSISKRSDTVNDQSDLFRVRINNLRERARVGQLTAREQEQLERAEDDLRRLDQEGTVLSGYSSSWSYKLRYIIRPVQMVTGLIFGCLSILLVVTLIIVNIDRLLHSGGPRQGYILLKLQIFNPLEYVLMKAQDLIFVGPLPLLLITSFLIVATVSGMRNLGLWFLFARLHRIKVGRVPPQALLYSCMTVMLAAAAFNLTLYSLAPQFVTFGNQNYKSSGANNTTVVKPCSLSEYDQSCILTRSSVLLMQIMSSLWIFGTIFYWWGWVFVVVSTVSFIAYLYRGKRQAAHDVVRDEDEDFED
uniref:Putative lysosomal cobalamin transporter n=1 Tax=Aceria tosichella TaxID=561515 RepID=A0A6G1SN97_9ACAR